MCNETFLSVIRDKKVFEKYEYHEKVKDPYSISFANHLIQHYVPIAQLDREVPYLGIGHGIDSRLGHGIF